jgi:hypothetical protein
MTPDEIKKKINNLMFGLHSKDPKDNNALPEILEALAGMAAPTYVDCGWSDLEEEPTFSSEQKAALLQEYNKGNLANVVCRYQDTELNTGKYFKIVAWEDTAANLVIIGANNGGTTTVKRWTVSITY